MLVLETIDYRIEVDPARGGAILRCDWRGEPLLRPACGPSIFDVSCFPLVPFSNRIAHGRFVAERREVRLSPNFPGSAHPHPLHGFGWLATWEVRESSAAHCVLEHRYPGGEWPWPYVARQTISLRPGLVLRLELINQSDRPMPAGLGFHPYFPRDPDTRYLGLHRGEWGNSDCLPVELDLRAEPLDWWKGEPVGSRTVDTGYAGREGPLHIAWPSRRMSLSISPSPELDHTVVFTPPGADFFCIEPVSHAADAINRDGAIKWLVPGESFAGEMRLEPAKSSTGRTCGA
jgi:aldose 1-epimerase